MTRVTPTALVVLVVGATVLGVVARGHARPTDAHTPPDDTAAWPRLSAATREARAPHRAIAVYVDDLAHDARFAERADEPRFLASAIKTLFLVEALRQRDAGQLTLDERVHYGVEDVRDGAPAMNRRRVGDEVALGALLEHMIVESDNAAADLVLARVGAENVRRTMDARGIPLAGPVVPMIDARRFVYGALDARAATLDAVAIRDVRWRDGFHPDLERLARHLGGVDRPLTVSALDRAHLVYAASGRNAMTARALGDLYAHVARGTLLGPRTDAEVRYLLTHAKTSARRLKGALPWPTPVAHKTGTLQGVVVDAGIVTMPDGTDVVMVVHVQGLAREENEAVIARLARAAYDDAAARRR